MIKLSTTSIIKELKTKHKDGTEQIVYPKSVINAIVDPDTNDTLDVILDKISANSGDGSITNIDLTPSFTEGVELASFTINDEEKKIYAPESKVVVGNENAITDTETSLENGNVYINTIENDKVTSSHKISGTGGTKIITDEDGNIVIDSSEIKELVEIKNFNITLSANNWVGEEAPYTQNIVVEGLSEYSNCSVQLSSLATKEEVTAVKNAEISSIDFDETTGSLTFTIEGVKPTIDIPVIVTTGASMNVVGVPIYFPSGSVEVEDSLESEDKETALSANQGKMLNEKINENIENLATHVDNKENPHGVTKSQVGLDKVDNTADIDKPVSTAQQDAIDLAYHNSNLYTDEKIADLINGAPTTLDTLKEISDVMTEHEEVVDVLNDAIGNKANVSDLTSHTDNVTAHITATERTNWNNASTNSHTHSNKDILDATTASYTTTEKTKLSGVETGANKYTHPTTSGNKHIPSGGSSGQILKWSADGTAVWGNDTTYNNFVKSGSGAAAGLVPAPSTTAGTTKYLREDGTWQVPPDTKTDTKNTTGTTNKVDTKLFLAGATSQAANPATYSNINVYIGEDNCLYSNGKKVIHEVTITATDIDFNTLTESGIYHIASTGGTNRPSANHGTLIVDTEIGTDYQLFIPDSVDTVMYKRSYNNTGKVWKAWTTQKLTDTTYSVMTGASSSAAGKAGLVPAPAKGAQAKFLRGDGTWQTPTNTKYTNASLGQGYGTCTTAAATVAKVVTLSSYALTVGGIVSVKFSNAVPANATMNINSKGAKNIFYRGVKITAGVINASDIATFIYDGTQYQLISIDATTKKRNFILIGDSYLAGYTPDGTIDSWGILLSQMLPQYTFNIQYITGSGFGTTVANKNFLDALKAYSGDKNAITDILVCGGYNDVHTKITREMISTGLLNFMTYAKANFPNAKIHLGFCGACSRSDVIYRIKDTVLMYQSCGNYGAGYISNMEYTVKHTRFLTSDKVHPNLLGQKNIAWNLASYIVSGNTSVIQQRLNCEVVDDSTVTAGIELFTSMNNETATLYHPENQVIKFSGLSSMTLNSKIANRIHLGTLANTCIMGSQLGDTASISSTNAVVTVPVSVLIDGNSAYMNGICTLEIMNLEVYLRLGVLNSNGKYIAGVVSTVILPPFTATFDSLDV